MSRLEEIHSAIVRAVGLMSPGFTSSQAAIDSGIFIKNIPYLTDEIQQLREELIKHLEIEGVGRLQSLICPIQGNTKEAIAVFQSIEGITLFINPICCRYFRCVKLKNSLQ